MDFVGSGLGAVLQNPGEVRLGALQGPTLQTAVTANDSSCTRGQDQCGGWFAKGEGGRRRKRVFSKVWGVLKSFTT